MMIYNAHKQTDAKFTSSTDQVVPTNPIPSPQPTNRSNSQSNTTARDHPAQQDVKETTAKDIDYDGITKERNSVDAGNACKTI
jgi:hypothetical protein